jgi:hypothetical protein
MNFIKDRYIERKALDKRHVKAHFTCATDTSKVILVLSFFRKKVVDDERHTDRGRVRCNSDAFISKTFGRRISIVIIKKAPTTTRPTDSDNKRSVRRRRRRLKVETSGGRAGVERAHALRQRCDFRRQSNRAVFDLARRRRQSPQHRRRQLGAPACQRRHEIRRAREPRCGVGYVCIYIQCITIIVGYVLHVWLNERCTFGWIRWWWCQQPFDRVDLCFDRFRKLFVDRFRRDCILHTRAQEATIAINNMFEPRNKKKSK